MSVRLLLTDEAWAEIASILTTIKSRAGSPPVLSDRMFIEAVLYLARTGIPWRDLPEAFGRWDAVYNRFRRWERRGLWRQLWERLQTDASPRTLHLFIDSTMVAYLLAADIVLGSLPIRLREVNQPVIITRNRCSRPRPRLLTCT